MRSSPGPEPAPRAVTREVFLARLLALAPGWGVTRLAEITGLDRIGLPVWQAVRPAGKALSVHQGKAATALGARIGALCEACESHSAEDVTADGPRCGFEDLAASERSADSSDYGRTRTPLPPDLALDWCGATDLLTGRTHWLPFDLVSLDFTRAPESSCERSSSGLAVGTSDDEALEAALTELLERDAQGAWLRLPLADRMAASLALETIPFAWFQDWRERLLALDIAMRVYSLGAIEDTPVFLCTIAGSGSFGAGSRSFLGTGADGDPERGLFKALAEAVQSRLTFIAGVRDDILPSAYSQSPSDGIILLGTPPTPPGFSERDWSGIAPASGGWRGIAERLDVCGYGQIVAKRLGDGDIPVVKCFVPGLGTAERTRRPPR